MAELTFEQRKREEQRVKRIAKEQTVGDIELLHEAIDKLAERIGRIEVLLEKDGKETG